MSIDTVQEHYIYVIGVNQGTAESWSRAYDGNFSMLEWAQHHAEWTGYTMVELVHEHTYMFMQGHEIVEVRWLISRTPMTQDIRDEWARLDLLGPQWARRGRPMARNT